MTRHELLERYRGYRQISRTIHQAALKHLSKAGFHTAFEQLGLTVGDVIVADNEDELIYAYDLALYSAKPGRSRAIDRYAKQHANASGDEARVIAALQASVFSLYRVIGCHDTAGVILEDLLRGGEVWLIDEGLEASAVPDLGLALRLATPDAFAISCGVIVPLAADSLADLPTYLSAVHAPPKATLCDLADDGHLARAVYQMAIKTHLADYVRYQ